MTTRTSTRPPRRRTTSRRPPPPRPVRRAARPRAERPAGPRPARRRAGVLASLRPAMTRARPGRRLTLFLACYLLVTAAIGWRLVAIQVVSADEYRGLADRQLQRELALPARRGKIYDRAGEPLAMSLAAATVYANPQVLRDNGVDPRQVAAALGPLLERDERWLTERLGQDAHFVYLDRHLPRQVGRQVADMALPGVGVLEEPTRDYPAGSTAAQVIGFTGVDNEGLSGLEAQYDDLLSGRPGQLRLERAPGGLEISAAPRQVEPPVAGADVLLTLDRGVQATAERLLDEAVEQFDAKGASAVVLDVATGEVLAMASVPTFDPADTGEADAYARKNRVVTDLFEPGSVNKVITAAAALEEGVTTPDEMFTVPDHYQVGGKRFRDSSPHEPWEITFAEIMERSSNVGTIKVAERLGEERLYDYLRRFGYADPTGVGFPGEAAGLLPQVQDWWATSLPTISIGQGVSATLLQVAGVFHTIATGGEWVEPTLVRGTVGHDGAARPAPEGERRRVVSPETAAAVSDMLVGVVESEHGTGARAAVPGYRVAGKTGTAQKPSETARGYAPGKYVGTFAGYAPVEDPAIVVAVMIDEPTPYYGGVTAAPIFSELAGFTLQHRRVLPSDDPDEDTELVDAGDGAEPPD